MDGIALICQACGQPLITADDGVACARGHAFAIHGSVYGLLPHAVPATLASDRVPRRPHEGVDRAGSDDMIRLDRVLLGAPGIRRLRWHYTAIHQKDGVPTSPVRASRPPARLAGIIGRTG